ncbi:DUF262 domain-containing protein [Streptomyces sp. CA-111067]|uniref:DUF262 domain-containing protein n=1 Tax=Streptomyces sp. CA-111067 TaxID=3240046 RepID=UPI003D967FD3
MTNDDPQAAKPQPPVVIEDVFEGLRTDVEVEQDPQEGVTAEDHETDSTEFLESPQIRVITSQFSLRNILDLIDEGSIELAPDFQRAYVWRPEQKSRLVESVLLQIPLPAFYFAENRDGGFKVVDGLQRLSTLHDFTRGGEDAFRLENMEYLTFGNGKKFAELPPPWQRRMNNAQLTVYVIDPTTPPHAVYDIFLRINTGGTPLNAQEIRHSMSEPRSREILKVMTRMPEFDEATGLAGHVRMNDREVVLRFAAFWLQGVDGYMNMPDMNRFLQVTTQILDDSESASDSRVDDLRVDFRRAMHNAKLVFGEHAFRKWPLGDESRRPINRALFETWSIALARYTADDVTRRKNEIVRAARERMAFDLDYLDAITSSTSDRRRVAYRFEKAAEDAAAGL